MNQKQILCIEDEAAIITAPSFTAFGCQLSQIQGTQTLELLQQTF